MRGVDGGILQELAGGVEGDALAAGAQPRVDAQHRPLTEGRLQEQVAEVLGKDLDGRAVGLLLELDGHIQLHARGEEALVGLLRGQAQLPRPRAGLLPGKDLEGLLDGRLGIDLQDRAQDTLGLPALDGQKAVRGDDGDGFGEVVVLLELRRLLGKGLDGLRAENTVLGEVVTGKAAHLGILGDLLGHDVARALQG